MLESLDSSGVSEDHVTPAHHFNAPGEGSAEVPSCGDQCHQPNMLPCSKGLRRRGEPEVATSACEEQLPRLYY